jgi:hypothetical protein
MHFLNLLSFKIFSSLQVVPNPLLDFSANVLRDKFSTVVRKPIFTFSFDRYQQVIYSIIDIYIIIIRKYRNNMINR